MNRNIARKLTSILLLLLMIAVFSVQTPLFFTVNNLSSILRDFIAVIIDHAHAEKGKHRRTGKLQLVWLNQ